MMNTLAMRPEFELGHLKYFYFTVMEGSVSGAADRLCVQQPVVSKMLKNLEERFEQPLFKKSGRRKVLTDFGQLVYRHCQNAFTEIEKLDQIKKGARAISGPLNFGSCEAMAGAGMAAALVDLFRAYPGIHPNVFVSTAHGLVEMIANRRLEFGLFFHLPELPDNLEVVTRIPVRFHLVVSRRHKRREVIERFIGSREIDDSGTLRFPTLERLRKDYPAAQIVASTNHLRLHREMVLAGLGCSVLPNFIVGPDIRKRELIDLYPKEKLLFSLKIVARRGESISMPGRLLVKRLEHSESEA